VVVAIARELRAFLWASAQQVPGTLEPPSLSQRDCERQTMLTIHWQRRSPGVVHPSAAV